MSEEQANTSPYKGLQPYMEADQMFFFGRERDQEIITANLFASALTIFYGASGVGKSSVLLAGVVPQLRQTPRVAVIVFREWQDAGFEGSLKREVLNAIQAGPESKIDPRLELDEFLLACAKEFRGSLFFILDQFEEYFLYHAPSPQTERFDAALARTVNRSDIGANFLLSMRDDGLSRLDRFQKRIPNLLNNMLRLEHLDRASAELAIRGPLGHYNESRNDGEPRVAIKDQLVAALLKDLQTGKVRLDLTAQGRVDTTAGDVRIETPFLQVVLTRLWDEEHRLAKAGAEKLTMRLATYRKLGEATTIVRTHLDQVMETERLRPHRDTAAAIFHFLVTPTGQKVAYTPADLASYAEWPSQEIDAALIELSDPSTRILRPVAPPPDRPEMLRYEIFHDVLAPAILAWRTGYMEETEKNRVKLAAEKRLAEERADVERKALEEKERHDQAKILRAQKFQKPKVRPPLLARQGDSQMFDEQAFIDRVSPAPETTSMKMFDERAFIAKVESAGPEELANILLHPTLAEEKALRAHLGDARYQRMHSMSLKRRVGRRGTFGQPKGNVVVIHGIMGSELSVSSGGSGDTTWVNAFRIMRGWIDRLRLSDDGRTEENHKFKVTATGIMKRYYGEMLLSLSENWNVKAFWFDWRKDLDLAADDLRVKIGSWFADNAPVHIVAHSMGGLVARTFILKYGNRWRTMWDRAGNGKAGGRLVMLGTPNHGSFSIPQVITGLEGLVRKISLLDFRHDVHGLLNTFNSFVGSYQMLPSPLVMPEIKHLYNSGSYRDFNVSVSQLHLDNARAHHSLLSDVVDLDRMIYVAGFDQPTFSGVKDWKKLHQTEGYLLTQDGDGRVTHALGLLWSTNKRGKVATYYIKESHGNLSTNSKVLAAIDDLLEVGETNALLRELPARRTLAPSQDKLRQQYNASQEREAEQLQLSLRRMGTRGVRSDSGADQSSLEEGETDMLASRLVSPEERKVEETITRGFLGDRGGDSEADEEFEDDIGGGFAEIEIGLVLGDIDGINYDSITTRAGHAIDVISVGHYIGVQPQAAELSLDYAVSSALLGRELSKRVTDAKPDLILTQYTDRGIIQGKLGQPFIIPDPRPPKGLRADMTGRLIALAGMNEPGRFGVPELVVLSRELCWALGRLNRLHLATVLIGAGEGNLGLRDAVSGWFTGIRRAISGSKFDEGRRLLRITFVERDPRKVIRLDELISLERDHHLQNKTGFEINYEGFSPADIKILKKKGYQAARVELAQKWKRNEEPEDEMQIVPARVTLSLDQDGKTYRFGAITDTASVPERDTVIDSKLVWQANDELAGEHRPTMQLERGRFLEGILMPPDLRKELYSRAPLVMMLDSTTARIHWEMVAQPSIGGTEFGGTTPTSAGGDFEYADDFLGTARGLTRQLRTNFAPPPEPPPPPQHTLRVLVVADPAADAHLPGAQEEGAMVAALFERYNIVKANDASPTRIQVKRLFGPIEATRTNVLRELMIRPYDVLHFAGHCVFQWDGDPSLSGWIFNAANRELLTANELYRIDRVPKFVFSNACESGITPDRSQERSDRLAPSFAEAFFARGVANFVCSAWPVDDEAARTFAMTLYSGLLGIDSIDASSKSADRKPVPMHVAIKQARLAIAATPNGRTTWGAYQHYGNPYFQFFFPQSNGKAPKTAKRAGRAASKKKKTAKVGRKKAAKKSH